MIKNFQTLLFLCSFFCNSLLVAQTNCPNNISPNCKWNSTFNCWGKAQFNGLCGEYQVGYPYYTSFTDSGDFFNKPITNNCQPWKFSMLQSNCCDNPNFNWNSNCSNDTSSPYSWASYPRMKVSKKGRLGGSDKCMEIFSYPGDHKLTSPDNCRSEACIMPETFEGTRRYYSWSFRFPSDWIDDDSVMCPGYKFNHYFMLQVHPYNGNAYNCADQVPVIIFNYKCDKAINSRYINVNYGCACAGTTPKIGAFPINLNVWYDVILNVKWSSDPDKTKKTFTLEVYANNKLIRTIDGYGPNLYKDELDTTQTVLHKIQIGLYRGEKNCTIQHMYFDEFSMAAQRSQLKSPQVDCAPFCGVDLDAIKPRITGTALDDPFLVFYNHQQHEIKIRSNETSNSHPLIIRLYDLNGRLAKALTLKGASEYSIDRSGLTNGIYFYEVNDPASNQQTKGKVIIY